MLRGFLFINYKEVSHKKMPSPQLPKFSFRKLKHSLKHYVEPHTHVCSFASTDPDQKQVKQCTKNSTQTQHDTDKADKLLVLTSDQLRDYPAAGPSEWSNNSETKNDYLRLSFRLTQAFPVFRR